MEYMNQVLVASSITVQLDGTKSKEQLYNFVYGDILNGIQNDKNEKQ